MNKTYNLLKIFKTLGLALILAVSLSACSDSWKEEVQLSDGKVIVVEREVLYESGGGEWASNISGMKPKEDRIRFEYPEGTGKIIEWRTMKVDNGRWPETPLVLDIKAGQPFVFSLFSTSNCCEVYSKYVYKNGIWVEELLPELFEEHKSNLLFASIKNLPEVLKLAEKNKRNDKIGHRQALYQAGPNRNVKLP